MTLKYYESPFHINNNLEDSNYELFKADLLILIREVFDKDKLTTKELANKYNIDLLDVIKVFKGDINYDLIDLFRLLNKVGYDVEIKINNKQSCN